MKMHVVVALAASLVALPLAAAAQDAGTRQVTPEAQQRRAARQQKIQKRVDRRFDRLDANHDGVISRDEWTRKAKRFDRFDANHDGVLSRDEVQAMVKRALQRRR